MSLCNILAFWAGRDAQVMDNLFRQSGLMRPKWDRKQGSGSTLWPNHHHQGGAGLCAGVHAAAGVSGPYRDSRAGRTAAARSHPALHIR